jgi:hypothetical protein
MKVSEKRKQAAYTAISDVIMRERLNIRKDGVPSEYVLDTRLFNMEGEIWKGICKAMDIK